MPEPQPVFCECGFRITVHHVLRYGLIMRRWRPEFVYLRFRCPVCHRVSERLPDFASWDPSVLDAPRREAEDEELELFDRMGPISPVEIMLAMRRLRQSPAKFLKDLSSGL